MHNAQPVLCYISTQTSQSSPNDAKKVHTWHDDA